MHLIYENTRDEIIAVKRVARHQSPHLHNALEIVCVTEGTLELGVGQELFHMEKGDIGLVFPDIIHHCQSFNTDEINEVVYINAPPFAIDKFADALKKNALACPAIQAAKVEPEVYRAIDEILHAGKDDIAIVQAYLQIILARCISKVKLVDKKNVGSDDIIYQTVAYVSGNFKHSIRLEDMAKDLAISKFALSRIFSKTFHRNFNQYLNDARLGYACQRLENTDDTVTEICLESGFDSQRTFNRVFKERYRMSPTEYRNIQREAKERENYAE